jgi:hypothetical protein
VSAALPYASPTPAPNAARNAASRAASLLALLVVVPVRWAQPATTGRDTPRRETMQVQGALVQLEPTAAQTFAHDVPLPAERTWALLPLAYEALGLPLSTIDPQRQLIAANTVRAQANLRGTRLSRYVNCGTGTTGVPNADSYSVLLDVQTQVLPTSDRAHAGLATAVRAVGRPTSTSGDTRVNCVSTGALERRLAEVVREQDEKEKSRP